MAPKSAVQLRRRHPSQARSRETVDAILTAGLELLAKQGPKNLTVRGISERAGVGVGSIYEYFGCKDGIVEAIFKREVDREWNRSFEALKSTPFVSVENLLRMTIRASAARHLRLYDLHPDFYSKNVGSLCYLSTNPAAYQETTKFVGSIMKFRHADFAVRNSEYATYLVVSGIAAIFRETVRDHPEYLRDPGFLTELEDSICMYLFAKRPIPKDSQSESESTE